MLHSDNANGNLSILGNSTDFHDEGRELQHPLTYVELQSQTSDLAGKCDGMQYLNQLNNVRHQIQ